MPGTPDIARIVAALTCCVHARRAQTQLIALGLAGVALTGALGACLVQAVLLPVVLYTLAREADLALSDVADECLADMVLVR
jgi:4-amino-4-deoxy-L-arabinose transferase-like glycosyltransferase